MISFINYHIFCPHVVLSGDYARYSPSTSSTASRRMAMVQGRCSLSRRTRFLPAVIFVSGQPAPVVHFETQLGLGRQESRQIVEKLLKIMKDTLSQGDDLLISGFGKFSVRQKKARQGRNPQTKESIILSARKVLVFKPSGVLRKRINEGLQMPE